MTEKILMIGFGATICLSLFSSISPLLNKMEIESRNLNNSQDILNFYEMITEIKRKSEEAIQFPGQDFKIHYEFSSANAIEFQISNSTTLTYVMERENQVFIDIHDFKNNVIIWNKRLSDEYVFYRFPRIDGSIEIIFYIIYRIDVLYFEIRL